MLLEGAKSVVVVSGTLENRIGSGGDVVFDGWKAEDFAWEILQLRMGWWHGGVKTVVQYGDKLGDHNIRPRHLQQWVMDEWQWRLERLQLPISVTLSYRVSNEESRVVVTEEFVVHLQEAVQVDLSELGPILILYRQGRK